MSTEKKHYLKVFYLRTNKLFETLVPANQVGVDGYQAASILMLTSLLDVPSRLIGGQVSGISFVRKIGQSVYVGGFVILLGAMNLLSLFVVQDYTSYSIWATVFGLCWGMPVSSQYSAIRYVTYPFEVV